MGQRFLSNISLTLSHGNLFSRQKEKERESDFCPTSSLVQWKSLLQAEGEEGKIRLLHFAAGKVRQRQHQDKKGQWQMQELS